MSINGASGIPLTGREVEYATELWLEDPCAFFLHPEGPLSETTPEEWLAKQPARWTIDPPTGRPVPAMWGDIVTRVSCHVRVSTPDHDARVRAMREWIES